MFRRHSETYRIEIMFCLKLSISLFSDYRGLRTARNELTTGQPGHPCPTCNSWACSLQRCREEQWAGTNDPTISEWGRKDQRSTPGSAFPTFMLTEINRCFCWIGFLFDSCALITHLFPDLYNNLITAQRSLVIIVTVNYSNKSNTPHTWNNNQLL